MAVFFYADIVKLMIDNYWKSALVMVTFIFDANRDAATIKYTMMLSLNFPMTRKSIC